MTPNEYQTLAQRTIPVAQKLDRHNAQLVNFALGLAGESAELLREVQQSLIVDVPANQTCIEKELGDCWWYISAICTHYNLKLNDMVFTARKSTDILPLWVGLVLCIGELIDKIKKIVFHGHDETGIEDMITFVVQQLVSISLVLNIDLAYVWQENIDKLMRRYPNGFSSADSVHRTA